MEQDVIAFGNKAYFYNKPQGGQTRFHGIRSAAASKALFGREYEIINTEYPGHATEIVRNICEENDKKNEPDDLRIYSCGGDGTLNEVINGFYQGGCPSCVSIGCVPVGSGNDFIKYFKDVPFESFLDISRLVEGKTKRLDMLRVGDKVSLNIISVGYDATVCKNLERFKRLPLVSGSLAYDLSAAYSLISGMKNRYTLYLNGVDISEGNHDYLLVLAANGRYYGGGFKAAPYAVADDGLIDFLSIKTISRLKFAKFVGAFRRGEHIEKLAEFCTFMHCKKLGIVADDPVDVNIDGEIIPMKNPEIAITGGPDFIIPN